MSSTSLFDIEQLQKLTYERSKRWASFLDKIAKDETLLEIDLNKFDDVYVHLSEEIESNDELKSMEDEECDIKGDSEVFRNVTNTTRLSLLFNNTLALPKSEQCKEQNELLDLFNQTLPIINAHNRQLKEFGFDKILSSFDKNKIEDKVGSWLNRHNSLFGGDNSLLCGASKKNYENGEKALSTKHATDGYYRSPNSKTASNDSDDSLQSGETARYIRSSRAGAIKNSVSTNTMIKTYRMMKSTSEKYTSFKDDHDYHLKTIHRHRKMANEQEYRHNHCDLVRMQISRKHETQSLSSQKQRRRVFRKRTNYTNDSSSDSEYCYEHNHRFHVKDLKPCCSSHKVSAIKYNKCPPLTAIKTVKNKRCTMTMPSACTSRRLYYYSHYQSKSSTSSSSSSSFSSICEKRRTSKSNSKFYNDNRPCKRESECQCCNERKLCQEYKHVADTSNEEWYVENSFSPHKPLEPLASNSNSLKSITFEGKKLSAGTEKVYKKSKAKINLKGDNLKSLPDKELYNKKTSQTKLKATSTRSTLKDIKAIPSDDEDWELKMAIELSKESYNKEKRIEKHKDLVDKKLERNILPTKPLRKILTQQKEFVNVNQTSRKRATTKTKSITNKDNNVEAIKLPRLIDRKHPEQSINLVDSNISTPNSVIPYGQEDTFFSAAQTQAICNSTALSSNGQAFKSQFVTQLINEKYEKEKSKKISASNAVTSTTIRSFEINSTLTSTQNEMKKNNESTIEMHDDNSDCTLVTSTTNIEQFLSRTTNGRTVHTQQQSSTLNLYNPLQEKGILIYAPENRNKVPANSFTSDGYVTITKKHLSCFIGEKLAEKFLKYYIGRKRFNSNSTVYYRPPSAGILNGNYENSSSDSDDDLENMGQYGDLYESHNKTTENHKNI